MQNHVNETGLGSGSTTLIATPGAGLRITVLGFQISNGTTANTATLGFSSSNQKVWQFGANGHSEEALRWEGDVNAALTISNSANGPLDVSVDYDIEDFS
jgi:hypothetical protein